MITLKGSDAEHLKRVYKEAFDRLGYSFFESGNHNLNIIGVRNSSGLADHFDDKINVFYKEDGIWVLDSYPVTTEPGPRILKNPLKEVRHKGTAILVPDQYRGTYRIGRHGSSTKGHTALIQRGNIVRVWRDNNRDTVPDYHGAEEEGWFGINIHKHRGSSARMNTGGVSAGCQVFKSSKDFQYFMDVCQTASEIWGNSFTYTLVNEQELLDNEL